MKLINTPVFSESLRNKGIDVDNKKILITNYAGSLQEEDLTEPANCNGFGRIRHFKLKSSKGLWPINPLPILPAAKSLNIPIGNEIKAQVFQNAVCNWRCWYCFVDFKLLAGSKKYSEFLSCDELIDLYLEQENPPKVIDLTGGQPDLTPEWVPWMMEALKNRDLDKDILLWSDDNLSNDYFWQFLSEKQIQTVADYEMYSRVCCFKGIDERSFTLNTQAEASHFNKQFELFKRFHQLGIDLYGYITLTAGLDTNFKKVIPEFLDNIQKIHENLPLRIVPLEIFKFKPVLERMTSVEEDLLLGQQEAIKVWLDELNIRFDQSLLNTKITEIKI
ncbi:radical SAM protein [Pelobium sp.]|nr:radical SAM protein [Pelobium sp.]MDA9554650.1 radical SAM protein [Pelobium sp.]